MRPWPAHEGSEAEVAHQIVLGRGSARGGGMEPPALEIEKQALRVGAAGHARRNLLGHVDDQRRGLAVLLQQNLRHDRSGRPLRLPCFGHAAPSGDEHDDRLRGRG